VAAEVTGSTSSQVEVNRWRETQQSSPSVASKQVSAPKPTPGLAFGPGSGSSSVPSAAAPQAPKQKTAPDHRAEVNLGRISTTLNDARRAALAYEKADNDFTNANTENEKRNNRVSKSDLDKLLSLKAERATALENSVQAGIKLREAVRSTIVRLCTTHGTCNFGSAREAAAKLDAASRADSSKLQEKGTITNEEVTGRQLAIRGKINLVLLDIAHDRLKPHIKGGTNAHDRAKIITREVASWAVKQEDYPAVTTPFGRLKSVVDKLKSDANIDPKNKGAVTKLIGDLVAECKKQGMDITARQKTEID